MLEYIKVTIVTLSVTNRYPKYGAVPFGYSPYWGIIFNYSVSAYSGVAG